MLSGDVESNPGPMSKTEADSFASALETIKKLEADHTAMSADLKRLSGEHETTKNEIKLLHAKIAALEATLALQNNAGGPTDNALLHVSDRLTEITSRCDNAENRQRRSNLLFFGIEDSEPEDWAQFEEKIINFCSERLDITTTSAQFERVHRLGRFTEGKNRPIIAKLTFFKDKQQILSSARKLKGSTFSIGEDFSPATRQARRKLVSFAKAQNKAFKVSVDRLHIDKKTYVYDINTDAVVLSSR